MNTRRVTLGGNLAKMLSNKIYSSKFHLLSEDTVQLDSKLELHIFEGFFILAFYPSVFSTIFGLFTFTLGLYDDSLKCR